MAYCNRGSAKNSSGDYAGAIEDYTKAIELDPKFAVAYCNRGNAKDSSGDYAGAIEDYTKAIELDPKFAGDMPRTAGLFQPGNCQEELRGLCGGYRGLHPSH